MVDTAKPSTDAPVSAPARRGVNPVVPALAVAAAVGVAVWVLNLGGGVITEPVLGLPPRDTTVTWLVPMLKLAGQLLSAGVVGCLAAAAFFVDGEDGRIRSTAWRWLKTGGWLAVLWAVVALVQAPATLADVFASGMETATPEAVWSYLSDTEDGFALALTAVLALVAGVVALNTLTVNSAAWATVIAIAAALPQVFTGHSASSGNHQIAVDSMILHVLGALLWTGGLLALLLARRTAAPAVRRYSRVALVAFVLVGASGVVNAATRLTGLGDLLGTPYGREVLAKSAALVVLGGFGLWHRRATIPRVDAGETRAFRRLAAVELVVMGATFGLAVALSRTPFPVPEADETAAQSLLGFPMPGPLTVRSLLLDWYPQVLICTAAVAGIGLYLLGVRRLVARGDRWPVTRVLVWIGGWGLAVFVTSSGMGRYSMVMFSVHMVQHMTLNMLIPIMLVLGAPLTLALRALRPARPRGPREWLLAILHSRFVRFVSHPLIALALYIFSLYLMYFTSLFEWAMRSHAGHMLMVGHFLAAGGLFFWVIIGPDPAPRRPPYPARVLMFFIAVVFHTIFGLTIMQSTEVIAADWFQALGRDWGASSLEDQRTGGGIAWAFGEIPSVVVLAALVWQWSRSEEREGRRLDRLAARAAETGRPEDDPHERYNAYLAKLAEADRKAGLRE
ncbi:putative copper resistance protein D [Stackebrandtia albiflava]|uniref:Putative copper resistance protein D n=1 Tax=Stackebrandtia albiflava TaxID=406432 RepID=A0A562V1Q3_9ACTN|nr:cytochrome c oxidase assembly protein [Stackebrandtia albiflava]TWJ11781.1 putative copper resistance protein D [Stackebrandtia albiflava]